jgi:hypothetical protein
MDPDGFLPSCTLMPRVLMARGFLFGKGVVAMKVVRFKGKNRVEVKKRVLDYYFCNREQLEEESMKDFFRRCVIDPNGKTAIYREQ